MRAIKKETKKRVYKRRSPHVSRRDLVAFIRDNPFAGYSAIAAAFNTDSSIIFRFLKVYKIPYRRVNRRRTVPLELASLRSTRTPSWKRAEIVKAIFYGGHTIATAAQEYGVSRQTIRRWLNSGYSYESRECLGRRPGTRRADERPGSRPRY
jgi:DNA invertase Pin-like site-specific DNA recombinase